jgi:hypothetical protein
LVAGRLAVVATHIGWSLELNVRSRGVKAPKIGYLPEAPGSWTLDEAEENEAKTHAQAKEAIFFYRCFEITSHSENETRSVSNLFF